ncbi:hypothetical protein MRX96_033126 [Rhipicephalus microplus]
MASEPRCAVELGFVEKRDAWALKSKYFPSKRGKFEFQVLPQLLNSITEPSVDSLDWGTLLVYTCKASCEDEPYREEYLWKQNFSEE